MASFKGIVAICDDSIYGENRHGCDALTDITSTYLRYQIRKSFVVDQKL